MKTLKRWIVLAACAAIAAPASAQSLDAARSTIMRAYIEKLPAGSRMVVTLVNGDRLRGVLMLVDGDDLVIRERKRIPEPPRRLPLEQIADVDLDPNGWNIGKAIAIGAGAGAAAALGVFFIIIAALD